MKKVIMFFCVAKAGSGLHQSRISKLKLQCFLFSEFQFQVIDWIAQE